MIGQADRRMDGQSVCVFVVVYFLQNVEALLQPSSLSYSCRRKGLHSDWLTSSPLEVTPKNQNTLPGAAGTLQRSPLPEGGGAQKHISLQFNCTTEEKTKQNSDVTTDFFLFLMLNVSVGRGRSIKDIFTN